MGVFVHDHKITAKLFQRFDRDPNQLRECIAANPQSVVAFYQPCTSTGSHGTLTVAMATRFLCVQGLFVVEPSSPIFPR